MNEEYKRNLAVPFFTQRDNTYIWQQSFKADKTVKPVCGLSNCYVAARTGALKRRENLASYIVRSDC